tara:strand:- start:1716 stop:2156 length:441 start_codon:yes stop_codon:yes gene_type:complete
MTAVVLNQVLLGDSSSPTVKVIYNNTTGGNVRLIFNFFHVESSSSGYVRIFSGPEPPYMSTGNDIGHPQGNYLTTVKYDFSAGSMIGKNLATYQANDRSPRNAAGNPVTFPTELVLANSHKFCIWHNGGFNSDDVLCSYNILAIPE